MSTTSGSRSEASARASTRGMWRSFVPRNAASLGLARGATAAGTRAGLARTDQVCFGPGADRSPGVQTSQGIDRLRELPGSRIATQLASPARCPVVLRPRHGSGLPVPLLGPHGGKRGSRTPSVQRNRAAIFGPVGGPWRSPPTGPAVETGNPHLSPRGTGSRRWWHSGLGPGVLAAGPATYRQYSYRWRLCKT
jgi:hypothetical protein